MYHLSRPLFLHCETPLHAGSGSELGVIDLPIQRERHTGFPKIEGSSLKGALRERVEQAIGDRKDNDIFVTFGPDGEDDANLHAGALGFTEARLLLFPVKSMRGVFAWVTCPQVINRFLQDMKVSGQSVPVSEGEISEPALGHAHRTGNSGLLVKGDSVVLEEYAFQTQSSEPLSALANWMMESLFPKNPGFQRSISSKLLLLNDEDFRDFVNLSTEVITRVKIDNDSGTVAEGALFTEEYLPAESILYSLVLAAPVFPVHGKPQEGKEDRRKSLSGKTSDESTAQTVMDWFHTVLKDKAHHRIQAGANATIGKGLIRTNLLT